MKQRYLAGLLLLGLGAGCTQDKYVLDAYLTMRYDVLQLPAPADTAKLLAVAFPSASVGFVGGHSGLLYTTTNGGQTWNSLRASLGHINHLVFSSPTAGWAATSSGLFRTTNGGQTWQTAQYASSYGYRANVGPTADVQFVTTLVGYAAGITGEIVKTTDGGANWFNQLPTGHQRFMLRAVSFTSPDSGQVVGETRYITTNGGRTWAEYGGSSNFFDYDVLLYGPGRYLDAEQHTPHFSDNPPFGSGGDTRRVNDDLNWPIYAITRLGGPGGPVAAVGQYSLISYNPSYAASAGLTTPWTSVHAPDGTSLRATFLDAAFADAHTLYAVGEAGALYRFHYQ